VYLGTAGSAALEGRAQALGAGAAKEEMGAGAIDGAAATNAGDGLVPHPDDKICSLLLLPSSTTFVPLSSAFCIILCLSSSCTLFFCARILSSSSLTLAACSRLVSSSCAAFSFSFTNFSFWSL